MIKLVWVGKESKNIMDKNLKNILIVIGVLAVLYYMFSPYQNCIRKMNGGAPELTCLQYASW